MSVTDVRRCFSGQVAIVTGGSAGIGRDVCTRLAARGARLAIVGRDAGRLERARQESIARGAGPDDVLTLRLDVRDESDMDEMAARSRERFGRIDILVHSAGMLRPAGAGLMRLDQTPPEIWDEVVRTNLRGTYLANRAVLPAMIEQRAGDILNLSSKSGRRGLAFDGPYCASKFGVIGLTEAIAEEVKSFGVRVQVLCPGTFETGVWGQAGPLPRPGNLPPSSRVADAIVFLLSLPRDACIPSPDVEPVCSLAETGWRGGARGGGRSGGRVEIAP
ncbi:MAG: SDR family oxidoreductase [Phycisphaerae bacterium]|jgi:NAD(P)-dependent dehydrogenase (short-subunit alcohol dehydrogenase family)